MQRKHNNDIVLILAIAFPSLILRTTSFDTIQRYKQLCQHSHKQKK